MLEGELIEGRLICARPWLRVLRGIFLRILLRVLLRVVLSLSLRIFRLEFNFLHLFAGQLRGVIVDLGRSVARLLNHFCGLFLHVIPGQELSQLAVLLHILEAEEDEQDDDSDGEDCALLLRGLVRLLL